jgi:hypothetical protein
MQEIESDNALFGEYLHLTGGLFEYLQLSRGVASATNQGCRGDFVPLPSNDP